MLLLHETKMIWSGNNFVHAATADVAECCFSSSSTVNRMIFEQYDTVGLVNVTTFITVDFNLSWIYGVQSLRPRAPENSIGPLWNST